MKTTITILILFLVITTLAIVISTKENKEECIYNVSTDVCVPFRNDQQRELYLKH